MNQAEIQGARRSKKFLTLFRLSVLAKKPEFSKGVPVSVLTGNVRVFEGEHISTDMIEKMVEELGSAYIYLSDGSIRLQPGITADDLQELAGIVGKEQGKKRVVRRKDPTPTGPVRFHRKKS